MKKTITLLAVCLLLMSVLAGFTAFFNRTEEVGYFTALKVTIRSNAINVYSIISLILGGIEFFIILLTGKEVPKIRSVWLGVLLFTLSFSYQCVSDMLPGLRKEVGAISIMVVTVFFYAYIYGMALLLSSICYFSAKKSSKWICCSPKIPAK